jgi:hypothetical protein
MEPESPSPYPQVPTTCLDSWVILNMWFLRRGVVSTSPNPQAGSPPLIGCLFNLFTATLHIGGRSSIRNLRTRHAVVTGTHIHGLPSHDHPNTSHSVSHIRPRPPCGSLPLHNRPCKLTYPYSITLLQIGLSYFQAKPSLICIPQTILKFSHYLPTCL